MAHLAKMFSIDVVTHPGSLLSQARYFCFVLFQSFDGADRLRHTLQFRLFRFEKFSSLLANVRVFFDELPELFQFTMFFYQGRIARRSLGVFEQFLRIHGRKILYLVLRQQLAQIIHLAIDVYNNNIAVILLMEKKKGIMPCFTCMRRVAMRRRRAF